MNDVSDAVGVVGKRFGVFRQVNVRDGLLFATWDRLDRLLCFQIDHSYHAAIVTDCARLLRSPPTTSHGSCKSATKSRATQPNFQAALSSAASKRASPSSCWKQFVSLSFFQGILSMANKGTVWLESGYSGNPSFRSECSPRGCAR